MKVIDNEMVVMIDIDDTLLMWEGSYMAPAEDRLAITDPYDSKTVYLKPHTKHIELVKKWKGRGFSVIVWSAGGYLWAKEAVKVLNLNEYVDLVMTKPSKYMDDLPAAEILGSRVYLPYKENV